MLFKGTVLFNEDARSGKEGRWVLRINGVCGVFFWLFVMARLTISRRTATISTANDRGDYYYYDNNVHRQSY